MLCQAGMRRMPFFTSTPASTTLSTAWPTTVPSAKAKIPHRRAPKIRKRIAATGSKTGRNEGSAKCSSAFNTADQITASPLSST